MIPRFSHCLSALLAVVTLSACSTTSLVLHGGVREFDTDVDSEFDDVTRQDVAGLELLLGILPFGLGLEFAGFYSENDEDVGGTSFEQKSIELSAGIRKTFRESKRWRPYIGGGVSYLDSEITVDDADDSDGTAAFYLHGGIGWHILFFSVGLDLRYLGGAEGSFDDEDLDLNYLQGTVFVGFSF